MKRIILIAIYPALCLISSAQVNNSRNYIEEMSVLEKSTFECVYSHIMYDADLDRDIPVDGIFQLGRDYAQYMRYGTYKCDSIIQSMDKKERDALTYNQLHNNIYTANGWNGSDRILFDLKNQVLNRMIYAESMYRYVEPMPVQDWEFLPGEVTVLGYKCRKARCTFRGREWTAWDCPEIKIPYGPWKLRGLPGMILSASDSTGAHSFTAIGLRTNPSNIYYDKRYELVRKVSQAECYKLLKEFSFGFSKESWKRYNEDPVNNHRPAVKHIFYVPHELDCEVDVK